MTWYYVNEENNAKQLQEYQNDELFCVCVCVSLSLSLALTLTHR